MFSVMPKTNSQPQEPQVPNITMITSDVERHMNEQGLSSIERDAIFRAIGAGPTKHDAALVVDVDKEGAIHPDHYVTLDGDDLGTEILPDTATERGLEDPEKAVEKFRQANYPNGDSIRPIDMQDVGQALFASAEPTKH